MQEELIVGRRYKVRLKPREELVEMLSERIFQEVWFNDYMDGQVGVLNYDHVAATSEDGAYEVFWEGTFWYYRLEWLKILGEV